MVSKEGNVYPLFEGLPEIYRGYCHRADIPENVSTLPLDFVLFSRKAWEAAGGIPEKLTFPAKEVDFFARMRRCGYEVIADSRLKIICKRKQGIGLHAASGHGKAHSFRYSKSYQPYEMKPKEWARLKKQWEDEWKQGDLAYNPNLWEGDGKFTFRKKG